jgi:hypothetical protein
VLGSGGRSVVVAKKPTHLVIDGELDGALCCLNCGARYLPNLPCPINVYIGILNSFMADHRGCAPREKEPEKEDSTA